MGLLAYLLIAKKEDIQDILSSSFPPDKWPSIDGTDSVKLSTLYALIKGEEYSAEQHHNVEAFGEEEGPWLIRFPKEWTSLLAETRATDTLALAEKWLSTTELQMDAWTLEDTHKQIEELLLLGEKAVDMDSEILLWLSL